MINKNTENKIFKNQKGAEGEPSVGFLKGLRSTERELRDIIEYLIQHRELLRDAELEKLENDARTLMEKLEKSRRAALLEEISCFKEILQLHREMIEDHDKPQH